MNNGTLRLSLTIEDGTSYYGRNIERVRSRLFDIIDTVRLMCILLHKFSDVQINFN